MNLNIFQHTYLVLDEEGDNAISFEDVGELCHGNVADGSLGCPSMLCVERAAI